VITRKMTESRSNKLFLTSICIELVATIFDVLANYLDSVSGTNIVLREVLHMFFLLLHNAQGILYTLFVISFLDMWHKLVERKFVFVLLALPYATVAGLILTNPFTHFVFSMENGYAHEPYFFILYISVAIYFITEGILIFIGRKYLKRMQILAMFLVVMLCITAMIGHVLLPSQLLECLAVALGSYILTTTVQRPEDYIDTMTGLFKLSAYANDAKSAFRNGKRWYVVMLNIANYESIVNMIGFEQAIELLRIVAGKITTLNKDLGKKGVTYFLDRGRFRINFPEKHKELAEVYANMLNNMLKHKISHNGFDISLVPCIVLACCPDDIESFKSLMSFGQDFHMKFLHAGKVMPAKEVYNPEEFKVANNIDAIIEKALETKSFQVYYQPIYSVEKKKFVSAEALLRLFDEEHGFISPEIIIAAAERSGAIHKIGEFVFEEVCKFISGGEFDDLGLEYVEVNLSVAQCMHGDLADRILLIMQQYNVSSDKINLEITETAASFAQRVMTENLNKLSRSGVSFSLDDYGTGYSNIKRVISLPLKIVKLDKSFVDEQHNPKMWILLQNTVQMLKAMNMQIVVEGIETQEMVDVFSGLKCDYIQGYFFSRPLPKADFVKLVESSRDSA
ncbi:MAG: EAL domain-containing protein, partial [Oscillospiraceae bacterium]|nr:EAL domain-containing protein [Oscillospiraceae bacterium]